jgi:hypothetical protein
MNTQTRSKSLLLALALILGMVSMVSAAEKAPTIQDHITAMAAAYAGIQNSLAGDSVKNVRKNAAAMVESADAALKMVEKDKKKNEKLIKHFHSVKATAADFSKGLKKDQDIKIDAARDKFYALSNAVIELVNGHMPEKDAAGYTLFYCPMAKGYWLQTDVKKLRNPYFGSEMLECGKKLKSKDYDPKKSKAGTEQEQGRLKEHSH